MSQTPPDPAPTLSVDCWRVDVGGLSTAAQTAWNSATDAQRQHAAQLAVVSLRGLTGGAVEPCAYVVRPCQARCTPPTWQVYPLGWRSGAPWRPALDSGVWINIRCGYCDSDCCHHTLASLRLEGATSIDSVWVGGAALDPSAYALRDQRLIRLDGTPWPRCQNLEAVREESDTFEVRYRGRVPGATGEAAAGRLASEFLAALTGGTCQLPSTTTMVARQGVTSAKVAGTFPDGLTGLRDVDAWTMAVNPHKLKAPSEVLNPDLIRRR